jgi:hypothetical protein
MTAVVPWSWSHRFNCADLTSGVIDRDQFCCVTRAEPKARRVRQIGIDRYFIKSVDGNAGSKSSAPLFPALLLA